VIFVCGLGFAEVRLNGRKVGDHVLDPGQTDYARWALYSAYDVTGDLGERAAIGVVLGNGRHESCYGFGSPRLILQLRIDYEDGSRDLVVSDAERWRCSHGPVLENGIYLGERYDARLEFRGWDLPGFNDRGWERPSATDGPPLHAQALEPIRVARGIVPKSVTRPGPGVWIFDFGENIAGWARLSVGGPRGTEVRLRFAETLHPDGTLNTLNNENARATDFYVLKGEGIEVWEPRFTYHGFRYVELTGFPGVPTKDALEARVVHSAVERTGTFHCSNPLINRIHENVLRGQLSNLHSVPTDCCQRDERMGWLGDAQLAAEESIFNFALAPLYEKLLEDIRQAQRGDGSLPDAVPAYVKRLYPADPAWATAYVTIAWYLYLYYGDTRVLERHYGPMRRYVDFLHRQAERGIQRRLGKYGDWCPPGSIAPRKTPLAFTATWYYLHDTMLLGRIAAVLGRKRDAQLLSARGTRITRAFNREFMVEGCYSSLSQRSRDRDPSQTSQALPLHLDIVPRHLRRRAFEELVYAVERRSDAHLDTGIIGTRYVPEVLSENGRHDLAFRLATRTSYPSWGYMIAEGATTVWERWEKLTGPSMNSHNHIMLGSIDAWFYKFLAGFSCLEPGWRALAIRPYLAAGLEFVAAKVRTVRGHVGSCWEMTSDGLVLSAEIPVGARADIFVPVGDSSSEVKESGRSVARERRAERRVPAIEFVGAEGDWLRFRTGSGAYQFEVSR
jgi:alpha-L-rhamnosidase